MSLLSNSPNFGQIYWRGLIVNHNNNMYQIKDANTNKKYVYWTITNPTQLLESNKKLDESLTRVLLFVNDKGMAITVPSEIVLLTWDGNNEQLVRDRIFGIYEDLGNHENKFIAIEQNIDGISTTVGQNKSELLEEISKVDQKADSIDLSVKKVEKEFGDNKELNELRENFNKSTIDFNSQLGLFKSDINSFFTDNRVTTEEKNKINEHIRLLELKRDVIITFLDKIIDLANKQGSVAQQSAINSSKTKFISSIANLKTYITTAISDGNITPSELTGIIDLFAKCNLAVVEMKNTIDEFLFLGAGGAISEELAKIGIKSNEIELSVSDLKTYTDSQIKITSDSINLTVSKKVGKDEIVSSINQSAEGIKISASKIDISGLVTFSDLSNNGKTVIHGGNIKTNTIKVDTLIGGTLNAMESIKFGGSTYINKMLDGLGGMDGMQISSAKIQMQTPTFTTTAEVNILKNLSCTYDLEVGISGNGFKANSNGNMDVRYNGVYNSYSGQYVSAFKVASNGNCSVAKVLWADDYASRITGGSIVTGGPATLENHWDILDSFNVSRKKNGIFLECDDAKCEYKTFLNPCLYKQDGEVVLSNASLISTLVNAVKELKIENDKIRTLVGVI